MSDIFCTNCGKPSNTNFKFCPSCGLSTTTSTQTINSANSDTSSINPSRTHGNSTDGTSKNPSKENKPKHYGFGTLVILIAIVIFILVQYNSFVGSTSPRVEQASEPTPIRITATQLFSQYEQNEVAADAIFKGKLLEVTGVVESIDSDVMDEAIVQLRSPNQFLSVSASGNSEFKQQAFSLRKGKKITLLCTGDGEIISAPQLKDCKFL